MGSVPRINYLLATVFLEIIDFIRQSAQGKFPVLGAIIYIFFWNKLS